MGDGIACQHCVLVRLRLALLGQGAELPHDGSGYRLAELVVHSRNTAQHCLGLFLRMGLHASGSRAGALAARSMRQTMGSHASSCTIPPAEHAQVRRVPYVGPGQHQDGPVPLATAPGRQQSVAA